jgi:hypothetical protein
MSNEFQIASLTLSSFGWPVDQQIDLQRNSH